MDDSGGVSVRQTLGQLGEEYPRLGPVVRAVPRQRLVE